MTEVKIINNLERSSEKIKIWSWRQAIAKVDMPSTTKLILYTLANYMNEYGQGCYPTVDTIAQDASVSKPTAIKALTNAKEIGFIKVSEHGFRGQKWRTNEYTACFPNNVTLGHDSEELNSDECNKKGGKDSLSPSQEGSKAALPRHKKGGKDSLSKVVKNFNPNSPINTPVLDYNNIINNINNPAYACSKDCANFEKEKEEKNNNLFKDDFKELFTIFPKRDQMNPSSGYQAALGEYINRRNEGVTSQELLSAAKSYRDEVSRWDEGCRDKTMRLRNWLCEKWQDYAPAPEEIEHELECEKTGRPKDPSLAKIWDHFVARFTDKGQGAAIWKSWFAKVDFGRNSKEITLTTNQKIVYQHVIANYLNHITSAIRSESPGISKIIFKLVVDGRLMDEREAYSSYAVNFSDQDTKKESCASMVS